ncbi:MAG: hypothetical protein ACNA8P_00005, partial [Phycisphaerales bacterium]
MWHAPGKVWQPGEKPAFSASSVRMNRENGSSFLGISASWGAEWPENRGAQKKARLKTGLWIGLGRAVTRESALLILLAGVAVLALEGLDHHAA